LANIVVLISFSSFDVTPSVNLAYRISGAFNDLKTMEVFEWLKLTAWHAQSSPEMQNADNRQ
jgi:hypothetical protein